MLKHGEYVAPYLEVLASEEVAPEEVKPGSLNGVEARYDKRTQAASNPSAFNNVVAVYRNAICIGGASACVQTKGIALLFSLLAALPAVFIAPTMFADIVGSFRDLWVYGMVMGALLAFLFVFVFPRWIWAAVRMDLFPAEDLPTIFDRKHRKIYRIIPPRDGSSERGWARFRAIEAEAVEYDWDCVTAEHRVTLSGTSNSVVRAHHLVMVVRDRPTPGQTRGRLLDEFSVGNSVVLGEDTTRMWWEHLRRFMEERGPAVPQDEPLHVFERPRTLWQSMGVVSPFGPRFLWWWRTSRFVTGFYLLILPFSLPFFTLWAVCNWISHKTMRKVVWPQEVLDRIGEPLEVAK